MKKFLAAICNLFAVGLIAFFLFLILWVQLINQGLQKPLGSLSARNEMRAYLETAYADSGLTIRFPIYNLISEEFCAYVQYPGSNPAFGLVYAPDAASIAAVELTVFDGKYYFTSCVYMGDAFAE